MNHAHKYTHPNAAPLTSAPRSPRRLPGNGSPRGLHHFRPAGGRPPPSGRRAEGTAAGRGGWAGGEISAKPAFGAENGTARCSAQITSGFQAVGI